jgi:hypothetical protein
MEKHLQVLGILFIVYGAMGLMAASIVFMIFIGAGVLTGVFTDVFASTFITTTIGLILTAILSVSAIPSILAGWGILRHKNWARILGLVFGVLILFEVPLGTALGIYALWTLLNDETIKLFKSAKLRTV